MSRVLQEGFPAGEISPRMRGLISNESYRTGAHLCRNSVVLRYANSRKRPGGRFRASDLSDAEGLLIEFPVIGVGKFMIELTNLKMRVWDQDENLVVLDADTELDTPYLTSELAAIAPVVSDRSITLWHAVHEPRVLEYNKVLGTWSFGILQTGLRGPAVDFRSRTIGIFAASTTQIEAEADLFLGIDTSAIFRVRTVYFQISSFVNSRIVNVTVLGGQSISGIKTTQDWQGPFAQDIPLTGAMITTTAAAVHASVTMTVAAGPAIFSPSMVGQIIDVDVGNSRFVRITNYTSPTVATGTVLNAGTTATTYATSRFYRIAERDTDSVIITPSAAAGTVTLYSTGGVFHSLHAPGGTERGACFFIAGGTFRVTAVSDANQATATVESAPYALSPIGLVGSTLWGQCWNRWTGYPRAAVLHDDRICAGGCERFGNRILASSSRRHTDWSPGPNPSDALVLILGGGKTGVITWMASGLDLLVGTDEQEFRVSGAPLSTATGQLRGQTTFGGANIAPIRIGGASIFVTASGRGLREFEFRFETDKYEAPDITDRAEHLFKDSTVRQLARSSSGDSEFLYVVMADGTLNVLSYRKITGVLAWSRWDGIYVESLQVMRKGTEDLLWLLVKRTINAQVKRYIEIISFTNLPGDSQIKLTGGFTLTPAVPHLEGKTVEVEIDGALAPGSFVVTGGIITLPQIPTISLVIGLSYGYKLTANLPEIRRDDGSLAAADKKTARALFCLLHESRGGFCGTTPLSRMTGTQPIGSPTEQLSQWMEAPGEGGPDTEANSYLPQVPITHETMENFEILAVAAEVG